MHVFCPSGCYNLQSHSVESDLHVISLYQLLAVCIFGYSYCLFIAAKSNILKTYLHTYDIILCDNIEKWSHGGSSQSVAKAI